MFPSLLSKSKRQLRQARLFTLVELLVVISTLVLLMGIVIGGYSYANAKIERAKTISLIKQIQMALESYKTKHGYYIQAATQTGFYIDDEGVPGPPDTRINFREFVEYDKINNFIKTTADGREALIDSYGNYMNYLCPGQKNPMSFDLWSSGVDGDPDTEDDNISNWSNN